MPSTADTETAYANSRLNLLACLALYQHRQDMANGIGWISGRTKMLLEQYKLMQTAGLAHLFSAAYYNGIIQHGTEEVRELAKKGQAAKTPEERQQILDQAIAAKKAIEMAYEHLIAIEAEG